MEQFLNNSLALALDSAPWLLFGLLAAGLIRAWLPMDLVGRSLGGSGFGPVVRAALIGAPLPLCSCSTLPAAFSLRRSGASRASTTSFLIATPETGVDSVALSWVLLGPFLAVIRPLAAIVSAITAGLMVGFTETDESPNGTTETIPVSSCNSAGECGCAKTDEGESKPSGWVERTFEGIGYAFTDLLDDLSLWLLVGILVAGLVVTLAPPDLLTEWGSGLAAMLLIMLISVPMYVCATASTPLALAMLYAGVSPGTVLVFLLAGPATNFAGLVLVKRELGKSALFAYLAGICGASLLLGLLLDGAVTLFAFDPLMGMSQSDGAEEEVGLISMFSLLLLVVLAIKPLRRRLAGDKGGDGGSCCE
ncbi:MAG: SO_0444 family Cu/Zn efflux transporter [Candidatus Sedimenticola sp. (ex Thyasira tokunagai)]